MLTRCFAILCIIQLCWGSSQSIAAPTAARVAGEIQVDSIHFTKDNAVVTQLSELIGPPGASPWTLNGQIVSLATGYTVGIGTPAPGEALDVVGNIRASGSFIGNGSGLSNVNAEMVGGMKTSDILGTANSSLAAAVSDINNQIGNLASANAITWSDSTAIQSSSQYDAFDPQAITYGSGNIMAVWRQSDGIVDHIMYSYYVAGFNYWSSASTLDFGNSNASDPRLASLASNGVMAVWRQSDGTRTNLWACRFNIGPMTWSTPQVIGTTGGDVSGAPAISSDSYGNLQVIWSQNNGTRNAVYARRFTQSMGWENIAQLDSDQSGAGDSPQLAVNPDGLAIAVWRQHNGSRYTIRTSLYSQSYWGQSQQLDTVGSGDSSQPQIAYNSSASSFAIAVWAQNDGTQDNIWWNLFTMGSWGTPALLETDDNGSAARPQIVVDPTGYPGHAMAAWDQYSGGGSSTIHARRYRPDNGWEPVQTIQRAIPGQASVRLALHTSGNAVAVWGQGNEIWGNNFQDRTGWAAPKRLDSVTGTVANAPALPAVVMLDPLNVLAVWGKAGTSTQYTGRIWTCRGALATDQVLTLRSFTGQGTTTLTAPDAFYTTNNITLPNTSGTVITTGNLNAITATGTVISGVWNALLGPYVVSVDNINDGAVTDAKITGPINGSKLGSHTHAGSDITAGGLNGSLINNNSIPASKLGEICADGDLLRYDAKANLWRCNPQSGAFTATEQFVGALTLTGITTSPADIPVSGFSLEISNHGVGTNSGKALLSDVRVQVPMQGFIPVLNQNIAAGQLITQGIIWRYDTVTKSYLPLITLNNVLISSQKAVPPVRSSDQTLVEYSFSPNIIVYTSPVNQNQNVNFNPIANTSTACNHLATPIFVVSHNISGVRPDGLFPSFYTLNSYQNGSSKPRIITGGGVTQPVFSEVVASGTDFKDGPCFFSDVASSKLIERTEFYTIANLPHESPAPIHESSIRLMNSGVSSYRIFSSPGMPLQQEISFTPLGSIYWGYYPYNSQTRSNGPIVEKGWSISNITPLP